MSKSKIKGLVQIFTSYLGASAALLPVVIIGAIYKDKPWLAVMALSIVWAVSLSTIISFVAYRRVRIFTAWRHPKDSLRLFWDHVEDNKVF